MATAGNHGGGGGNLPLRDEEKYKEKQMDKKSSFDSIENWIDENDVKELQDAGIYTCRALLKKTKKRPTDIKGLSEAKVDRICVAAHKILDPSSAHQAEGAMVSISSSSSQAETTMDSKDWRFPILVAMEALVTTPAYESEWWGRLGKAMVCWSSSPTRGRCAVCKHEQRGCPVDCPLARFFPVCEDQLFKNAHHVFGSKGLMRDATKDLSQEKKTDLMMTIMYQANARRIDPVLGIMGIIRAIKADTHAASADRKSVQLATRIPEADDTDAGAGAAGAAGADTVKEAPARRPRCGACKAMNCKCSDDCKYAPYFPPTTKEDFAALRREFSEPCISSMVFDSAVLPEQRQHVIASLLYEEKARRDDPIYGCFSSIADCLVKLKEAQQSTNKEEDGVDDVSSGGADT
ncbi:hypothetical protein PR202_ga10726 [Eleusine coracana subsp. coracana]|uniref:LOB domain-containing protein n=1 Tax=Eleusine coracana subsp. coracana TaxID=191504 RepID=A0AAV5C7H9_ELECO|nr:hypothetical protein PR202_ga10726 [Eleusine coracana subsp. coracana]